MLGRRLSLTAITQGPSDAHNRHQQMRPTFSVVTRSPEESSAELVWPSHWTRVHPHASPCHLKYVDGVPCSQGTVSRRSHFNGLSAFLATLWNLLPLFIRQLSADNLLCVNSLVGPGSRKVEKKKDKNPCSCGAYIQKRRTGMN